MTNWKTTLAGVVVLVSALIAKFAPQYNDIWQSIVTFAAGLGLIAATDSKKTEHE